MSVALWILAAMVASSCLFVYSAFRVGAPDTPEGLAREADQDYEALQAHIRATRANEEARMAAKVKGPKISEKAFTAQVLRLASLKGWRTAHFRTAMNRSGRFQTPVQGDGAGYPDLTLVRGDRLIFAELKTDTGRTSPAQDEWLAALRDVPRVEVHLWRPRDWDAIAAVLT